MAWKDVPGNVLHYRGSDDSAFYESANERFIDQSNYASFGNYMNKIIGTPAFTDAGPNNRRALYLDNQCHWEFPWPVPWHGTLVLIAQWEYFNVGTVTFYPMIFGEAATVSSNTNLRGTHSSGNEQAFLVGAGAVAPSGLSAGVPDSAPSILAWSRDQENRVGRYSVDGISSTPTSPVAGTTNGNGIGFGGQPRVRVGNLNGTAGNTDDVSGTLGAIRIFDILAFQGDQLASPSSAFSAEWAASEAFYGVS